MAKKTTKRNTRVSDWPFGDPKNFAVLSLKRVVREGRPVLHVVHDEDDGAWQFLDGKDVSESDASVVALETMVKHDPTLVQVAALPRGWYAVRERVGSAWWVAPVGMTIREAYA